MGLDHPPKTYLQAWQMPKPRPRKEEQTMGNFNDNPMLCHAQNLAHLVEHSIPQELRRTLPMMTVNAIRKLDQILHSPAFEAEHLSLPAKDAVITALSAQCASYVNTIKQLRENIAMLKDELSLHV